MGNDGVEWCIDKPVVAFSTQSAKARPNCRDIQKMDRSPWDDSGAITTIHQKSVENEKEIKEFHCDCLRFNK
jgi:hypothetical protein